MLKEAAPVTTIVVPTLNESGNIGRLIDRIYAHLDSQATAVIVVDDDSTDGTQDIVRTKSQTYPGVKLVVRSGLRGLGSAVRLGASYASDGPVIVMDADLSHDPSYAPDILSRLAAGYDLVVGSRYVKGGSTVGWPGSRIAVSKVATLIARLLFLLPVRDPMSGFVGCQSARVLTSGFERADYKFLLEILVRNRQLRVAEVPIIFRDRRRGKSKLGGGTIILYLALVSRLLLEHVFSGSSDRQASPVSSGQGVA